MSEAQASNAELKQSNSALKKLVSDMSAVIESTTSVVAQLQAASTYPEIVLSEPEMLTAALAGAYVNVSHVDNLIVTMVSSSGLELEEAFPNLESVRGTLEVAGTDLPSVVFPKLRSVKVLKIGGATGSDPRADEHNPKLTTVSLPSLERVFKEVAFAGNAMLKEVHLPKLVRTGPTRNPSDFGTFYLRDLPELKVVSIGKLAHVGGAFSIFGAQKLSPPTFSTPFSVQKYVLFRDVPFSTVSFLPNGLKMCSYPGNGKALTTTSCTTGTDGGDCYQKNNAHGC